MDDDGDEGRACEELSDGSVYVGWFVASPLRMYVVLSVESFLMVSKFQQKDTKYCLVYEVRDVLYCSIQR